MENNNMYIDIIDITGKNAYGHSIRGYGVVCVYINTKDSIDTFQNIHNKYLTANEKKYLENNKFYRRKESFLLGRLSAKYAYDKFISLHTNNSKLDFQNICVEASSTGKPILKYMSHNGNCQITITHSQNIGISFVYDEYFSFGIDLEFCNLNSINSANEMLNTVENYIIDQYDNDRLSLLLWSAKESIGKYLGIGLSVEYSIFEVCTISRKGEIYCITFKNFSRHKVIGICKNNFVLSIAYYDGIDQTSIEHKLLKIANFITNKYYTQESL